MTFLNETMRVILPSSVIDEIIQGPIGAPDRYDECKNADSIDVSI